MLKGVHPTPWNRHAYAIFIDNDFVSSQWGGGAKYFSSHEGALPKIIEKR